MIKYTNTSIFESQADALVNPVNTVGIMGKGLALEFKKSYPAMFSEYRKLCLYELLTVGELHIYKATNKTIINFPTKVHWRQPSKLSYIERGLDEFVEVYEKHNIKSASFPMLGCGYGGLSWGQVKPLMGKYLGCLPIEVYVHIYGQIK